MRQNYLVKLVRYMKNVYHVDSGFIGLGVVYLLLLSHLQVRRKYILLRIGSAWILVQALISGYRLLILEVNAVILLMSSTLSNAF